MGHNHSAHPRNKLNKNSNTTNCKLSMIKPQPSNSGNRKKRLTLKLPLSQPSLSSQSVSLSPIFSASISSTASTDFTEVRTGATIKDMMVEILDNKISEKMNSNATNSKLSLIPTTSDADYEKFFISFHQKQQQISNNETIYDAVVQHRVAFISLIGLYQSFRRIPTHILFSSLFILKLRREWLYDVASHPSDTHNVLHTLGYDEDEEFMMLLKWKDSQGLLLFMWNDAYDADISINDDNTSNIDLDIEDNHDMDSLPIDFGIESDDESDLNRTPLSLPRLERNESQYNVAVLHETHNNEIFGVDAPLRVHPMWIHLSHQLSTIYDSYQGSNFMPLIFDKEWWLNDFGESQYGASPKDILNEMNACHMNYRCVMEILFQSNPSLVPCKSYKELANISTTIHCKPRPKKIELSEINAISDTISRVDSVEYLDEREFTPYSPTDIYWNHDANLDNIFNIQ